METALESELVDFLARRLFPRGARLVAVYLFGSAAHGELRSDSDLDVAFLGSTAPDSEAVFRAAQDLTLRIGREIDVLDLSRASTVMRAQVVGSGRRIFTGDESATDTFEMLALSDYARLEEERAETISSFLERYRGG